MLTKEMIRETIDTMPENFTVDQVIEEIEQGIKDANEGRVYTTEQIKEKLKQYKKI